MKRPDFISGEVLNKLRTYISAPGGGYDLAQRIQKLQDYILWQERQKSGLFEVVAAVSASASKAERKLVKFRAKPAVALLLCFLMAGCAQEPKAECPKADVNYLEIQWSAADQGYQQAMRELKGRVQAIADKDAFKRGWEAGYSAGRDKSHD